MTHSDQQICLGYRLEYQGQVGSLFGRCNDLSESAQSMPGC